MQSYTIRKPFIALNTLFTKTVCPVYAEGHTDDLMGQNLKRTLESSALEESIGTETNTVSIYLVFLTKNES